MKQQVATAIILQRIDYGEADRIITMLTAEWGKIRLLAKGVRRIKSKLAGGIELFSVSEITFIKGRGDIGTLVSSRLIRHYGGIVGHLDRTMLGYELIKQLNKVTEDEAEDSYFMLLRRLFEGLDDSRISLDMLRVWFDAQLLRLGGQTPNLLTDVSGTRLRADGVYRFDTSHMSFTEDEQGIYRAAEIKFIRLLFSDISPVVLAGIQSYTDMIRVSMPIVRHSSLL